MLLLGFVRYLITAVQAVRFPYGIDYGEGIVWQQMHMIMAGQGYGQIAGFPAIAFPYPPLYYVVSSLTASLTGIDELAAGRLLSVGCAIASAAITAGIAAQFARVEAERTSYWICGALAGLIALCTQPVLEWSLLMRVDMLYVAFSLAGLYFGMRALVRPGAIYLAALCFVAAIFTKQIAVAAPMAVFGVLLFARPRTAWAGIASTIVVGLIALAGVMRLTDGGFLLHIVTYTITKFKLGLFVDILEAFGIHFAFCAIAFWGIAVRWRRLQSRIAAQGADRRQYLRDNPSDARFLMALAYLVLATLLLAAVLKRGSAVNYFLEWAYLIGLFAGLGLLDIVAEARENPAARGNRFAPLILWAVAVQAFGLFWIIGEELSAKSEKRAELGRLVALVKAAPQPVISDDMVAVLRGGKTVQWEPFIFAELAGKGAWDETPLVDRIRAQKFAFFVTEGYSGDNKYYDERYDAAVAGAIRTAYPLHRRLAGYNLHFPGPTLPAYAEDLL